MPVITLISDWGSKDHYVGAVKGALLRYDPSIQIVDITHQIKPFDILQSSFVLRNAYPEFPEGTIHIVGVNTDESKYQPHLAIFHKGHYFIGADNGIFSLAFGEFPEKVIGIEVHLDTNYFTFSTRDRFVKAACHIASGKPIEALGYPLSRITERTHFKPVVEPSVIKGMVVYIDNYENIFVNITKEIFDKALNQRKFLIQLRGTEYSISKIQKSYSDVEIGDAVAVFGTTGLMEIAINKGKASSLLGIDLKDTIRIEFE